MDERRWTELSVRFEELLDLPAAARVERLRSLAAGEPGLAAELERLLAAHGGGRVLGLERGLDSADRSAAPTERPPRERIGPYRLLSLLGEGGMGEVWLAERDEPGFRRRVALKRIRRGLASDELRRRFAIEREALARLSHRGIAQLLDGGVDEEGVPYLALEHVEGLPLTAAADRRRLTLDQRLLLFEEVCGAVAYAHARLVVHRDLKPSNIFLTEAGEVRLLDFGIAKLLDPDAAGHGETRTALRLATPEYASPEQLEGAPVTTATDVHALGLLLFELATGRRAYRDHETTPAALESAVRRLSPPRPSEIVAREHDAGAAAARRTTPAALARALRGDLDTIVATALQKDPARRYPSVERLADDLRRCRRGEPIRARPESAAYRLRKFVGRHRLGVATVTALALLVTGFAAYAGRQSALLARERDAARAERDKAREISAFLIDLFGADPYADDEGIRDSTPLGEVLERSEAALRRELAERPELRAALLARLGRLHGNLGRLDRARALAEEALALRRALPGDARADVAESLTTLATIHQEQDELALAEAIFREALALREAVFGAVHPDVAESVHNLAVLLVELGDPARAAEVESLERRALALRERLFGDDHLDTAQSRNSFASFLAQRGGPGDRAEAERLYRRVLEVRVRKLGPGHPTVANLENNLANLLDDEGREAEAVPLFEDAIRVWSAALGPDHPRVSTGYWGLSGALADRGDLDGALAALRASIAIDEKKLPPGHRYLEQSRVRLAELEARRGAAAGAAP